MVGSSRPTAAEFDRFVADIEPRLRAALVATYGAVEGRAATVDALSWAWEDWDRVVTFDSPVGYLYRVGQTAAGRNQPRPIPAGAFAPPTDDDPAARVVNRDLIGGLADLAPQQRAIVVLVHGFGWSQRDVAEMLGITPATVAAHLRRAVARLERLLEVRHVS